MKPIICIESEDVPETDLEQLRDAGYVVLRASRARIHCLEVTPIFASDSVLASIVLKALRETDGVDRSHRQKILATIGKEILETYVPAKTDAS